LNQKELLLPTLVHNLTTVSHDAELEQHRRLSDVGIELKLLQNESKFTENRYSP
jgi:hypothetical protein